MKIDSKISEDWVCMWVYVAMHAEIDTEIDTELCLETGDVVTSSRPMVASSEGTCLPLRLTPSAATER